jgi:hypothetical protein
MPRGDKLDIMGLREGVVTRWFWFGLLTSSGYLVSNQLLRLGFKPSAAAALSALVGTSIALLLVRSFATRPTVVVRRVTPAPRPLERLDPTPPIGLGLGGEPLRATAPAKNGGNGTSLIQELMPLGFHPAVDEFKRRLLSTTIDSCGGNRAEAARRLGLQRTYLYRLTKQLAFGAPRLPAPDFGAPRLSSEIEPAEPGEAEASESKPS